MHKENVVYPYNGILFKLNKKGNPAKCAISQSQKRQRLHNSTYMRDLRFVNPLRSRE